LFLVVVEPPHHWPAPVANHFIATESLTKKACNRLLQQNLPKADILIASANVRYWG
jgi:hypothetical protein